MLANFLSISLLTAPLLALASPHNSSGIAKRQSGDVQLQKRFSDARWSWHWVGLGTCGRTNVDTDFVVALNAEQYGSGSPNSNCFKTIIMNYNGKTTIATIVDECPGCPYGGLDLSAGLFEFFAPLEVGVIFNGTWFFYS